MKNPLWNAIGKLAVGSIVGRAVTIAATPILTRIYTPSDFGIFALFSSIIIVCNPLLTLRYSIAMPLARGSRCTINLFVLCTGITTTWAVVAISVLFTITHTNTQLAEYSPIFDYWILLVVAVFFASTNETLISWATKEKKYSAIAKASVAQSLTGECTKIALGLIGSRPAGLIFGLVTMQMIGFAYLLRFFMVEIINNRHKISLRTITYCAIKFKDFPVYRLPGQILLVLAMQCPIFIITFLFDSSSAGQYGLANTLIFMPFLLFGQSISRAFYGEIASYGKYNIKSIRSLYYNSLKKIGWLALPVALLVALFGYFGFAIAFGPEWVLSGEIATALAPIIFFQFLTSPFLHIFSVLDESIKLLQLYSLRLLLTLSSFCLGWYLKLEVVSTIYIYSFTMIVYHIIALVVTCKLVNHRLSAGHRKI